MSTRAPSDPSEDWRRTGRDERAGAGGERPTIVLLGAPPGNAPLLASPLAARVDVAARLFHAGASDRILVTGVKRPWLDEIGPMCRALAALDVPFEALLVDPDGLRTLTSLIRARDLFAIKRGLVVTNPFHMPRALFLARALGLDVKGVAASEREPPRRRTRVKRVVREGGAFTRAVIDVAWIRLAAGDATAHATRRR